MSTAKSSASTPVRLADEQIEPSSGGYYAKARREFFGNRAAVAALIWVFFMIFSAVFAHVLTPYDPLQREAAVRLNAPSLEHPMGTDSLGRDILARVLYGGRLSLQVGFYSIIAATLVGVPLGLMAGYFGGRVDNIIMRMMDVILAFPGLILIIWLVALLGSNLTNVIFAIAFFSLPTYSRLVRGVTLSVREMDYVMAARSMGAGSARILVWHIFPSVIGPLIVLVTLSISGAIVTGASLSFLGLGVPPPTPEWGSMLADGRAYLRNAWWIAVFPGFTITLLVLAANIVGDGLRDALDPRTQR
jgi:peptide/nickel transport system permease protein